MVARAAPAGRVDTSGRGSEAGSHFLVELGPEPSAAPRLLTRLHPADVTTVEVGRASVTYVGPCLVGDPEMRRRTERAVGCGRLADLTDMPGSYHVLVSTPDGFTAFGDPAGLRRVFYGHLGGGLLVGDRADVLAHRVGARLDDGWLALWLVWPPPGILSHATPWEGIAAVPPGSCLIWRHDGTTARVESYWAPPASDLAVEDAATGLADALATAVHERVRRAASPSLDLSGGKDSTALAFLAACATPLLAVTLPSISPDNHDESWARAVAAELVDVEHLVIPATACPLPFDDLEDGTVRLDHPSVALMHSARRRRVADLLRERGRGADHLSGHGGDEVLQPPPGHLSSLLRRHPALALSRLRAHCALTSSPFGPALRSTLLPGSYARWLQRAATDVAARRTQGRQADFGWGASPRPSPWLTDHALRLAAAALQDASRTSEAAAGDIAGHVTLSRIRTGATTVRLQQQFLAGHGVRMHCPYLDRHVVERALAVHPHERSDPSAYKPLLDAAMATTVPARFRARPTKGHYTEDTAWGLHRNRGRILRFLAGARLAERGLVDLDALCRAVRQPRHEGGSLLALTDALSCERWLRSTEVAA